LLIIFGTINHSGKWVSLALGNHYVFFDMFLYSGVIIMSILICQAQYSRYLANYIYSQAFLIATKKVLVMLTLSYEYL